MTIDPALIRVPFLRREVIHQRAEEFRAKFVAGASVPVDILLIAEFDLGLEIRPIAKLRSSADIEAALLNHGVMAVDRDHFMDDRFQNRLRFSMAHEVGHFWLHSELYGATKFESVGEWVRFMTALSEKTYAALEFQAHEFAGRLLVPPEILRESFGLHWGLAKEMVKNEFGEDLSEPNEETAAYVADRVGKDFGVSGEVIVKRLKTEGLLGRSC